MLAHAPSVVKCVCARDLSPCVSPLPSVAYLRSISVLPLRRVQLQLGESQKPGSCNWWAPFGAVDGSSRFPPGNAWTRQQKNQVRAAVAVDPPRVTPMGLEVTEISEPNSRVHPCDQTKCHNYGLIAGWSSIVCCKLIPVCLAAPAEGCCAQRGL